MHGKALVALFHVLLFAAGGNTQTQGQVTFDSPVAKKTSTQNCGSHASLRGDAATVSKQQCAEVVLVAGGGSDSDLVTKQGSNIRYSVRYAVACSISEAQEGSCYAISEPPCPGGEPLITRWITALNGANKGKVVAQSTYCTAEPRMAVPVESITSVEKQVVVTPARFQRFPIRGSITASQPQSFSLRNGHAHIYAVPETQVFVTEILGKNVRVRAIPTAYAWNYGDGTSRTLNQPGAPDPGHTFYDETPTSHVYTETGDYQVRLSTRFRGEYSTEGGPWIPIPGVANVPSEPMLMSVWRTRKLLVDTNCIENPKGPACDSPFLDEKP